MQKTLLNAESLPDLAPIEVEIVKNEPVASQQWGVWVKLKGEDLPPFLPGTFCMLSIPHRVDPLIPRAFAIAQRQNGMYLFIYRVHGKFTHELTRLPQGANLGLLGPVGKGFSSDDLKKGKQVFVAGGVGYASLLPLMERAVGASSLLYYGVRTENEIIRRGMVQDTQVSSDDGSIGYHGRLPALLKAKEKDWKGADAFYVCGPTGMMRALYDLLPREKTYYFLEETMGCGVGICVGCVIPVSDEQGSVRYVRSCVEGPIFNGIQLKTWSSFPA